ncbi:transmembrane protein 135-like [Cochliomyia hominivorax]
MSSFSKFFEARVKRITCQELGLHSISCRQHFVRDIFSYSLSNFKYFAPICLLPALLKIRSINRKKLKETLEYYLTCSLLSGSVGLSINGLICLIRHFHGEFGYYSAVFIPSLLSGTLTFWFPENIVNLYQTTLFQCDFENFFIMRKNFLSRTIADSKSIQTVLFMICSSIILHAKQFYNAKGFWLLVPNFQIQKNENDEKCSSECKLHPEETCKEYLLRGMSKYFLMGFSLDLIKMLMSKVNTSENYSKISGKLINFWPRSTVLLTSYVGIYRFANCWLNGKRYFSDSSNHILSSFLAGSSFYLSPQLSLFSFGLVQMIRCLWKIFDEKNINNPNKYIKKILEIPFGKIMLPFALASFVHIIVLHPKYASTLSISLGNGICNNYPSHGAKQFTLLKAKFDEKL